MKKQIICLGLSVLLSCLAIIPAQAGEWYQKSGEWRYRNEEEQDIVNDWIQDQNRWYFLNSSGNLVTNAMVDEYYLGDDGAWVPADQMNQVQRFAAAYQSGNSARIYDAERTLFDKCVQILNTHTDRSADKYENEKKIHDYLVRNTIYDMDTYNNAGVNTPSSSSVSYQAAGVLLNGTGVCSGYADAFRLLCEMAQIPCITVAGTADGFAKGAAHAWNQVRLDDGQWYWVDLTFDDPVPDQGDKVWYKYFNVTSAILQKDHQWTGGNPAEADKYSAPSQGIGEGFYDSNMFETSPDIFDDTITSQSQMEDFLYDEFDRHKETITFHAYNFTPKFKTKYKDYNVSQVKITYEKLNGSTEYRAYTLTITYGEAD